MKTLTISIKLAVIVAGVVVSLPLVASAQNRTDLKQHYGAAIGEVYRTPSHLMVTAYFDEDGNICREHVESENRGSRMTDDEVKTVLDEIAPENERGKHKIGTVLNIGCPDNDCAGVSEDYERLKITKIGSTNKYRYVSVVHHSTECKHWEADKRIETR